MRWRHRLVLRDQRRERKKREKVLPSTKDQKLRLTKSTNDALSPSTSPDRPRFDGLSKSNPTKSNTKSTMALTTLLNGTRGKSHTEMTPTSDQSTKNMMHQTSRRLLEMHHKHAANEASTHIRGLPFPILTFGTHSVYDTAPIITSQNETFSNSDCDPSDHRICPISPLFVFVIFR